MCWPSSVRVLGICGLTASALAAAGGFLDKPYLIGVGGLVMVIGNLYAMWRG